MPTGTKNGAQLPCFGRWRQRRRLLQFVLTLSCLCLIWPFGCNAGTLADVRDAGALRCGVIQNGRGLTEQDSSGNWHGFFVDFCRVIATAVLGDPDRVIIKPLSTRLRFEALRSHDIDVLVANTTITVTRSVELGVEFPAIYLYDGQGFMAHRDRSGPHLEDIDDRSICVLGATTSVETLTEYIRDHNKHFSLVVFRDNEESFRAFFEHQCDLITNDRVVLSAQRALHAPDPVSYVIYPDIISKEPLSPTVRNDDSQWSSIIRWTIFAVIAAEEKGITSSSKELRMSDQTTETRRLLGFDPKTNQSLGLTEGWGLRIIQKIGNYGEIFNRNMGTSSDLKLDRGTNSLWNRGGLMYSPPFL